MLAHVSDAETVLSSIEVLDLRREFPASCWRATSSTRPIQPSGAASFPPAAELERLVRAHKTPQRLAKRAKVILLAGEGMPNRQISKRVGMAERYVARWRAASRRSASRDWPTTPGRDGRGSTATRTGCGW